MNREVTQVALRTKKFGVTLLLPKVPESAAMRVMMVFFFVSSINTKKRDEDVFVLLK